MLNLTIRCKLIDDPKLLEQWNYDEPLLELYNDLISTVIPMSKITHHRLRYELCHIHQVSSRWIAMRLTEFVYMSIMARKGTVAGDKEIEKVMSEIMRR